MANCIMTSEEKPQQPKLCRCGKLIPAYQKLCYSCTKEEMALNKQIQEDNDRLPNPPSAG